MSPWSLQRSRTVGARGNTAGAGGAFRDTSMTTAVLSPAGVAALFAHLLLLGLALVLQGLALQSRTRFRRVMLLLAVLACAALAFGLAADWIEVGVLALSALWMAPVLLGL